MDISNKVVKFRVGNSQKARRTRRKLTRSIGRGGFGTLREHVVS